MVKRIVLTGGPGSGKTTVIDKIQQVYSSLGYRVIVIDETATYLINKGIKPFGEGAIDLVDFQEIVMRMQLAKEDIFDRAISMMGDDAKVLIVYDRGTIDNTAYINREQFEEVLSRLNHVKDFSELMNKYDLVIDLVGRKDFYTTANNEARSEDADTALKLGENTLRSWIGHNNIKIVLPKDIMDDKVNEVLNRINEILSEKQVKRQEKYVVDLGKSDMSYILENGKEMNIEQSYLTSNPDVEKRIRKVLFNGCESYYLAVYKVLKDGSRVIVSDKQIEKKIYDSLLEFRDEQISTIHKKRYYFSDNGQYFYLDIFEDNKDNGILEINVNEDEKVTLPSFISVIDRVTGNERYYNKNLARRGKVLKKEYSND